MGSIERYTVQTHNRSIYNLHSLSQNQDKMAPVEVDVIPYDIMAPVKNLKAVIKAFELPLVTSVYNEIVTIASPLTPYVETTKTKMEESVIPHLPEGMTETLQSNMTAAAGHLSTAVEKVTLSPAEGLIS